MEYPVLVMSKKWNYLNFALQSKLLKTNEIAVYTYLLDRVAQDKGYAYPPMEEVADAIGKSRQQATTICRSLEEKQFIIRDIAFGRHTRFYFNKPEFIMKYHNLSFKDFPIYKYNELNVNEKMYFIEPQSKPRKTIVNQDWSEPIEQPKVEPKITIIEQPKQFQSFEEEEFYKMFE